MGKLRFITGFIIIVLVSIVINNLLISHSVSMAITDNNLTFEGGEAQARALFGDVYE